MCGISGFSTPAKDTVSFDTLKAMGEAIVHRGPDHLGYYYDGRVGLAHNRLSLLDLSAAGNQPFEDERHALVYNGEIYNFSELRSKLTRENGVTFRSTSDTEVLFQLLIHDGIEATLQQIEGMFAFCFFDKVTRRIVLARDRVGIKPLFYALINGTLFFASELKALKQAIEFVPDQFAVLESTFGYLEYTRRCTAFSNVYQVTPGTFVTFEHDRDLSIRSYFQTTDLVDRDYYEDLSQRSTAEVVKQGAALLQQSVERMLVSDAPVGVFLSGGVDSSLLTALASRRHNDIQAFTANVTGRFSEFPAASKVAKHVGVGLRSYKFEPEMFIRDWVKATFHYEAPIVVHTNAVPFFNVCELAGRHRMKAVLTGEGADELFLGYPRLLTKRYEPLIKLPYTVLNFIYGGHSGLRRYVASDGLTFRKALADQKKGYESDRLQDGYRAAYSFMRDKRRVEDQARTLWMLDNGLHSLLWRNDRMGMAHSLEARFPFLDEPVLRFGANLPVNHKIRRVPRLYNYKHPFLVDKFLVRKVASDYLPADIAHRSKRGFPMHGHQAVTVQPEYFVDSFWSRLMNFSKVEIETLVSKTNPYLIAKIVSVDIWGRLFLQNESVPRVAENLSRNCTMTV